MKAWFVVGTLKRRAGVVTDYYGTDYVELYCAETKDYHIRRIDTLIIID